MKKISSDTSLTRRNSSKSQKRVPPIPSSKRTQVRVAYELLTQAFGEATTSLTRAASSLKVKLEQRREGDWSKARV